jgi:hypothetical protein
VCFAEFEPIDTSGSGTIREPALKSTRSLRILSCRYVGGIGPRMLAWFSSSLFVLQIVNGVVRDLRIGGFVAMALSPGAMLTHAQSWAAVEEKLQMDVAIWKSEAAPESRPKEYRELVEGALIKLMDRGVAIISIGKLEWEVAPPSAYCDQQDDWLLVSPSSGFRVALRSPHGRQGVLQVCPCGDDLSITQRFVDIDDELNNMLARFFSSEGTHIRSCLTISRLRCESAAWQVDLSRYFSFFSLQREEHQERLHFDELCPRRSVRRS